MKFCVIKSSRCGKSSPVWLCFSRVLFEKFKVFRGEVRVFIMDSTNPKQAEDVDATNPTTMDSIEAAARVTTRSGLQLSSPKSSSHRRATQTWK